MSAGEINPYAAPSFLAPPPAPADEGIWQQGRLLLVRRGTPLPDRCVLCNAPADGRALRRKFFWHHPLLLLLPAVGGIGAAISSIVFRQWIAATVLCLIAGFLVYTLAANRTGQSVTMQVGICYEHAARRRRGVLVGWTCFLAALAVIGASWLPESYEIFLILLCGGLALLVVGPLYGLRCSQFVWPRKVNKEFAWVGGVCNEYLAALPLIDLPP